MCICCLAWSVMAVRLSQYSKEERVPLHESMNSARETPREETK